MRDSAPISFQHGTRKDSRTSGDKVTWKEWGNYKTGTIKAFKDTEKCIIDADDGGTTEKKYDDLSKTE